MAAISYPSASPLPRSLQWNLTPNTKMFTSPLSMVSQTIEYPGALWSCAMSFAPMTYLQAQVMEAWIISLVGRSGRASLYPFHRQTPRGTLNGTVQVNGAGQTGTTLLLKNCGAGTSFLAGDFFSVNSQLVQVQATATANGAGLMTVTFRPPLRQSPANSNPITYVRPLVTMALNTDSSPVDYSIGQIAQVPTLQFIEALDLGQVLATDTPPVAPDADISILPGVVV